MASVHNSVASYHTSSASGFNSMDRMPSRKRPHSPDSADESVCRNSCDHHITFELESESPLPTDEDSESVHSLQLASTASAKDTSDLSWTSDSVMDLEIEEYEVASDHSDEKLFSNCDSSGTDDLLVTATALAPLASSLCSGDVKAKGDSLSPWADSSNIESNDTTDSEVPRADYWECVRCRRKCTPLFRFCLKCFQLRKGYFPERPRRTHPRRRPRPRADAVAVAIAPRTHSRSPSPQPLTRGDSGVVLSAGEATPEAPATATATTAADPATDTGCSSQEMLVASEAWQGRKGPEEPGEAAAAEADADAPRRRELCFICVERPRNGGFVHRRAVHVLTCYQCALKVWNGTRRCPMCNERPQNVAKVMFG